MTATNFPLKLQFIKLMSIEARNVLFQSSFLFMVCTMRKLILDLTVAQRHSPPRDILESAVFAKSFNTI